MISTVTNIDSITFDDGLPENSLLNFQIPSQSDTTSFIHQIIEHNEDKISLFITTTLPKSSITRSIENYGIVSESNYPQIEDISSERDPVNEIESSIDDFPSNSIIIIDSLTQLESLEGTSSETLFRKLNQAIDEKNLTVIFLSDKEISDVVKPHINRSLDGIISFEESYDNEEKVIYLEVRKLEADAGHEERYALTYNNEGELQNDTMRGIS
jgi:KaiC/GvpD/RAD55 family RecA-like ATPase